MKVLNFALVVALLFSVLGFTRMPNERYTVDTKNSVIEWKASKVTGSHNGTINLASGYLVANGNSLKGGSFVIDMNTLNILDLQGESKKKLDGHLRSDDFFSVSSNPTSTFNITRVASAGAGRVNITGDLTIKGKTSSITFPATVKKENNTIVAVAKGVKVDRTKYDIKYRSKSFFGDLGDKAIDDEFELSVNLVAKR